MASLLEQIKGKREQIKQDRAAQTRAYKFKPGKTVISLLPLHSDLEKPEAERGFYRQFGMHFIKNVKGENVVAVGDRSLCFPGQECPVRDGLVEMIRYGNATGDDTLSKIAKESLAKKSYLINGIVHQDPDGKKSDSPELFSFSENLLDQLLSTLEEYLADPGTNVLGWKQRMLFVVEREGTTMTDTRYKIMPLPRKLDVDPSIMTKAVNLEEYVAGQFSDVPKALSFISTVTGKPVSAAAFAGALTGSTTTPAITKAPAASDDDLLAAATTAAPALARSRTEDAKFEEVTPKTPAPSTSEEDLLNEIDNLAA